MLQVLGLRRPLVLRCRYKLRRDGIKGDFILRKSGNRQRILRIDNMKQDISATIPAATTPVEELAARTRINPDKLRLALNFASVLALTIDLGNGIHAKVKFADDNADEEAAYDAMVKRLRLRRLAAPPAGEQHQSLLAAPPASKRIQ